MPQALFLLLVSVLGACAMRQLYQWDQLDFDFGDPRTRDAWIKSGAFQPINTFPLDADYSRYDPKGRIFVTVPRFFKGVPATLNTVVLDSRKRPLLRPYPSWKHSNCSDCTNICSVLRTKTTDCGQLWVLDSGVDDVLNTYEMRCPPKLVVYDLIRDSKVWEFEIPKNVLAPNSLLGNLDVQGSCSQSFVYIADIAGHAIIVVDTGSKRSWRVQNKYTEPDPASTHFNINGESFDLNDGVISVAVANNALYFHSLASKRENLVPTLVLQNQRNFLHPNDSLQYFYESIKERTGQSGPGAAAKGGSVMIFSNLPEDSMYCWKVGTPFTPDNLYKIYQNDQLFQFPSGLKVIKYRDGSEWVLAVTSRFQKVINKHINPNELNYRVLIGPVDELLAGTPCAPHPIYEQFIWP